MLEFVLKFKHEAWNIKQSHHKKNPSWVLLQAGFLEQIPAWNFGIFPCVCFRWIGGWPLSKCCQTMCPTSVTFWHPSTFAVVRAYRTPSIRACRTVITSSSIHTITSQQCLCISYCVSKCNTVWQLSLCDQSMIHRGISQRSRLNKRQR